MGNKKILFIAPNFFNYPKMIIEEMIKQGYDVDYYDDRPSKNTFIKGMIKINKRIMDGLIKSYFKKILNETKDKKYDLVLIIACKVFSGTMINELRATQKDAKFILYLWDSIENYPHIKNLIHCFDHVYSFDLIDCQNYQIEFLPLFYSDQYKLLAETEKPENFKYDISSIGTAHPNRYHIYKKFTYYTSENHIRLFLYMFLASRLLFLYNKLFESEFKKAKMREFGFHSLSENQVLDIIKNSKAVLDVQHHLQSGLTMRTIECLGAKKKIITTNVNIKQYDFYHPDNILVIENECYDEVAHFLSTEYTEIAENTYIKYHLSNWLKQLIN